METTQLRRSMLGLQTSFSTPSPSGVQKTPNFLEEIFQQITVLSSSKTGQSPTAMAALDNPLFVLTKHPLTVFSKLLFEEKITLPEFESICNRLLLSPVHILTRIMEPQYQSEGNRQSVAHLGLSDRWKAF